MIASQREALTRALSAHVTAIAADLRAQMLAEGPVQERAKQLHIDEQVGDDFAVWTDLLSWRAAVLWVLKTVYVRVLEDRGLLRPARLADPEAQRLFEQLAPSLGDTAFLRWVFRDLASSRGGLPELFGLQPAELALPADARSRALIAFWQETDAETGVRKWSFSTEEFAGELMGDLYQELDPVVKERYALCQTPDFVRDYMLSKTLTPAIAELGADKIRVLDPACGSGHFLLDAMRRLIAATALQHAAWSKHRVVEHVLDRVVGIDLNDYACALARARMVMTAAELAGVTNLADAARFHPNVYWADGLEQIERDDDPHEQLTLLGPNNAPPPRAVLTRPEVRRILRLILKPKFHVIVGNPPYITERDEARKAYHREMVGAGRSKRRRYQSAYKEYSLASPFIERSIQLAETDGRVGLIVGNNFMKRDFGKPLIEDVLAGVDLQLVVDTAHAVIPHHGTPTAMLFLQNRAPRENQVRAVVSKRDELPSPTDPANGKVWRSILEGQDTVGYNNDFVSVSDFDREVLQKHPWSIGGGGAAELKGMMDGCAEQIVGEMALSVGRTAHTGADDAYVADRSVLQRRGLTSDQIVEFVEEDKLRDWALQSPTHSVFPYTSSFAVIADKPSDAVIRWLWPYRALLWERREPQGTHREIGFTWHQYSRFHPERFPGRGIAFAFVASQNHFVMDPGGKVFKQSAPVIKLPVTATDDDYLALLGFLNSSIACFWMKQVFQPKTHAGQRHHPDPARAVYEFTSTGLHDFPVPTLGAHRRRIVMLASSMHQLGQQRGGLLASSTVNELIARSHTASELRDSLATRWHTADVLRERMIALQEELDWVAYAAFGLANESCLLDPTLYEELTCPRGSRPVERLHSRISTVRAGGRALTLEEGEVAPVGSLPESLESLWGIREQAIQASDQLRLVEVPLFKRAWRDTEQNIPEAEYRRKKDNGDLGAWLAELAETWARTTKKPFSRMQMTVALEGDGRVGIVAELLMGRSDFSLEVLVSELLTTGSVPCHPLHTYTDDGIRKRASWEHAWELQRREDNGENIPTIARPEEYSQGSRGKSKDYCRDEYWRLRGKLDVPKERFIAFTEIPGRGVGETLYGWAGRTPLERVRALLAIDEQCEDQGIDVADRIAVLDSAWRLVPDIARDDAAMGSRLRAELAAIVGAEGPSTAQLETWKQKFPPPTKGRGKGRPAKVATVVEDDEDGD